MAAPNLAALSTLLLAAFLLAQQLPPASAQFPFSFGGWGTSTATARRSQSPPTSQSKASPSLVTETRASQSKATPSTPLDTVNESQSKAGQRQSQADRPLDSSFETVSESKGVIFSEIMTQNKGAVTAQDGGTPDWVELHNPGSATVNLKGYKLTIQKDGSSAWQLPALDLDPGEFLVVYLDGKGIAELNKPLHADFTLSKDPVEDYVALLAPNGDTATAMYYPWMAPDVSFGVAMGSQSSVQSMNYAMLASPTPGQRNSAARAGGPLILRTVRSPSPRPDGSEGIEITATVRQQQGPVSDVELVYKVGYGQEKTVRMTAGSGGQFSAVIPRQSAAPGSLVRWYVQATDSAGQSTRDPPFAEQDDRQYYGTIVVNELDPSALFTLEMYCPQSDAPFKEAPTKGCSILINDTLYDNVDVSRRGTTSLAWPKPKILIDSRQGSNINMLKGWRRVNEIRLNGAWAEPGENTFMREPLVWRTFGEAGVESVMAFHVHVRFNGKYFGLFSFHEQINERTLQGWGFDVSNVGPLWKGINAEKSNFRHDLSAGSVKYNWKKYTRKGESADDQALVDFSQGISGGGPIARSQYLFDAVNLPQVINHMAAQTMILNQDRCTKNFWTYFDLTSKQWNLFPWDLESGFGIDRPLGGAPVKPYCVLACEQWNSPLFCDRNHPQDPRGGGGSNGGRRLQSLVATDDNYLLQHAARKLLHLEKSPSRPSSPSRPHNASRVLREVDGQGSYDEDFTKQGIPGGFDGNFNFLIDAILAVPRTRQMYLRRLRSLMDEFIPTGRLQAIISEMHNQIRDEAKRDVKKWGSTGDPDRGYKQLISEQLPIRKDQLYSMYGPGGSTPLIPGAQPSSPTLQVGSAEGGPGGYVQVLNPNAFAVDISRWSLEGAVQFMFRPGTVIPAQDYVFVATDINAFKQRSSGPKGGEGQFVVGPSRGVVWGSGAAITLKDKQGRVVASA